MAKIGHETWITWPQCDFWIVTFRDLTLTLTRIYYGFYTHTVPSSNLRECFGRVWACLSQVGGSGNQNAETLNFDLWPDLDLTSDLFNKIFKSAIKPSRRDLSKAASPVSLRSLVWELAWWGGGALYPPPPVNGVRLRPRSSADLVTYVIYLFIYLFRHTTTSTCTIVAITSRWKMTMIKTIIGRRRIRIRKGGWNGWVGRCRLLLPKWRCAHIQYLLVRIRLRVSPVS